MLNAHFVRSDMAWCNFRITGLEAAAAVPGIRAILTAREIGAHLRMPPINPLVPLERTIEAPVIPESRAAAVGQPIALIVGEDPACCRAARELLSVDYDSPAEPFDDRPVARIRFGEAIKHPSGEHSVSTQLQSPRVAAVAMEPRACLARWDPQDERLDIWLGTQSPARARDDIAATLGLERSRVRVIAPDVGGAFGAKASVYPEDLILALAARRLGAALRWTSTRSEEFAAATQGRGSRIAGELTFDTNGRFRSVSAHVHFDLGAWMPFSSVVPMRNAARILPGPYQVKQIHVQGEARPSPQAAVNIYRGAGRPEATLLMETLVEAAARALKIDPIAVRRTNLLNPDRFPAATPTGETLDSGDYPRLLDLACARFDYERERREQQSRRERGERVGIGAAFYVEPCGQGWEWARVTAHAGGTFTVASGSPAQGQGHLTTWAAIAAEALGCAPEAIEVVIGDTAQCPQGIGSLASRSTAIGGSAIVKACRELLEQRASGRPLPMTVEHRFDSQEAWSAGCILARVVIDRDTGDLKVEKLSWADDAGRIIQPELARGQLLGGAAQGLGQALMEQIHYDAEGQLLTGSLMDYAIPRAADMPPIDIASIATPSPNNPLGAKGVGEAGCIGVPAAVMNAVRDALSDLGEVQLGFPLNAEQIWRLIHCPQSELSK
jgi:carbon-monoxide dehydrogenase large subunit